MQTPDPPVGDRYRVETPERIDLEYDVASLGSRLLAAMVDTMLVSLLMAVLGILGTLGLASVFGLLVAGLGLDRRLGAALALPIILVLLFALFWGYYVFFELVWHGQSPGKRWVGLRVIKEGGYPIGFVDSAIRNLVRLVDFLPAYYVLGAMVMFIDRRSRRLGDLAAGTLVVKERRELKLESLDLPSPDPTAAGEFVPFGAAAEPSIPNLWRLTPADQSLLREYSLRRPSLSPEAAATLAVRLAGLFARKLEYDLAGESPEAFLARLSEQLGHRS